MTATCKTSKQTDTHSFPHDCILNFIKHAMKMYFCLLSTNLQHTRTDEICAHILQITDRSPLPPPPAPFLGCFPFPCRLSLPQITLLRSHTPWRSLSSDWRSFSSVSCSTVEGVSETQKSLFESTKRTDHMKD